MLRSGLKEGNKPSLTVSSDSMSPLLQRGDQIGLQQVEPALLKPGQIITFAYQNQPHDMVTHRFAGLIEVERDKKIVTWADRTLMFDKPSDLADIIGRVVWRRRNKGQVSLDGGRGAWLSRNLYKLACWELLEITGLDLSSATLNLENMALSEERRKKGKRDIRYRFLRRLSSYGAQALSIVVDGIS